MATLNCSAVSVQSAIPQIVFKWVFKFKQKRTLGTRCKFSGNTRTASGYDMNNCLVSFWGQSCIGMRRLFASHSPHIDVQISTPVHSKANKHYNCVYGDCSVGPESGQSAARHTVIVSQRGPVEEAGLHECMLNLPHKGPGARVCIKGQHEGLYWLL
jgi:hypothetical protein